MGRRANQDGLQRLSLLINAGHPMKLVAKTLGCTETAVLAKIRRNAHYFIARLPSSKYTTMLSMFEKKRLVDEVADTLDMHITLINCAHGLYLDGVFPPRKESKVSSKE